MIVGKLTHLVATGVIFAMTFLKVFRNGFEEVFAPETLLSPRGLPIGIAQDSQCAP